MGQRLSLPPWRRHCAFRGGCATLLSCSRIDAPEPRRARALRCRTGGGVHKKATWNRRMMRLMNLRRPWRRPPVTLRVSGERSLAASFGNWTALAYATVGNGSAAQKYPAPANPYGCTQDRTGCRLRGKGKDSSHRVDQRRPYAQRGQQAPIPACSRAGLGAVEQIGRQGERPKHQQDESPPNARQSPTSCIGRRCKPKHHAADFVGRLDRMTGWSDQLGQNRRRGESNHHLADRVGTPIALGVADLHHGHGTITRGRGRSFPKAGRPDRRHARAGRAMRPRAGLSASSLPASVLIG